jgi:8-oxo-dGTP diphosphatase
MGHIHSNEQYDFTVSGILVHSERTLLLKHKFLPFWTPPAGHIELDETPEQALYREIEEEAGIKRPDLSFEPTNNGMEQFDRERSIADLVPFDIESHPIGNDGHRHIDLAYIFESATDILNPGSGESQEIKWFSHAELDTLTGTPVSIIKRGKFAIELVNRRNRQ